MLSGLYGSGSITDTIFGLDIPAIGAIWFLLALLWGFILLKIIIKIERSFIRVTLAILCFAFGVFTAKYVWLPFSIQPALCAVLFLYVGWEVKKKWGGRFAVGNRWTVCGCLLVWLAALAASFLNTNMSLVRCAFPNGVLDVSGAIAASWLIIRLSIKLEKINILAKLLKFFGENSLIVMCVHLVELSCFPWSIVYQIVPYRIIAVVLVYICKVLFNAVVVVAIKKGSLFACSLMQKQKLNQIQ